MLFGDGNSVLFLEESITLNQQFDSDRTRDIPKFLYNNTTEFPNTTSHTETTIVDKTYNQEFFLYFNGTISVINLDDSWLFSVKTSTLLGLGTTTLSNDDDSPILQEKINYTTHYRKVENKVSSTIDYFDVVDYQIDWWSTLEFRSIYAFGADKRYKGILLSVAFDDNPDSELPIEIVRSLTSVTLDLQEVEEYPTGLAEPEEILVVPQDNLSVLLRDRLLSEENKKYCNLVGDLLYFAKSVDIGLWTKEKTICVKYTQIINYNLEPSNSGYRYESFNRFLIPQYNKMDLVQILLRNKERS